MGRSQFCDVKLVAWGVGDGGRQPRPQPLVRVRTAGRWATSVAPPLIARLASNGLGELHQRRRRQLTSKTSTHRSCRLSSVQRATRNIAVDPPSIRRLQPLV